jgi:hypothetical protein
MITVPDAMKIPFLSLFLTSSLVAQDAPPLCPGAWTLVHIPDVQNYVSDAGRTEILHTELQWLVAQRAARNIRFAVQVGDLTNDNGDLQWNRCRDAFATLIGQIPFAACSGNHDCGPGGSGDTRATQFSLSHRFGMGSPYELQPSFRGSFQHPDDPPGNTQNAWHTFRVGLQDYLVLTCEWGPRDAVVSWMNDIAANHPHHRLILVCHAYLASGSQRYDWNLSQNSMNPHSFGIASLPGGVNDGEELWDQLVKKYANFCLICCGHAGRGFRTATGIHGNRVHEMLFNTQDLANGGNGLVRLLEFYPDGRTVQAHTYSTHLNEWDDGAAASFRFTLSPVSSTDSDADGMPDYYEAQHGWNLQSPSNAGGDADHDGCSNLEEYIACTSPLNSSSALRLTSVSRTSSAINLAWESVPGVKYEIQHSDSPAGAAWASSATVITAADFAASASVPATGSRGFYRIKVTD